jgi:hypothetical protein
MSSPPVNIPREESSGSRRSALTSAFEELALFADQKTDEVRFARTNPSGTEPRRECPRDETRSMRPTHESSTNASGRFPRSNFFSSFFFLKRPSSVRVVEKV